MTSLPTTDTVAAQARAALERLGGPWPDGSDFDVRTPITGAAFGGVAAGDVGAAVDRAHEAFGSWRAVPAPVRGQVVRRLGELLREHKDDLATLVGVEVGKIGSEALGEVQEMIDMCELAVGMSRQLYGRSIASERPAHRLTETWHPLGVTGVITAFNFPVAVWAWNACLAFVCGDPVVWKPSEKTVLSALGCQALFARAAADVGAPPALNQVVVGGRDAGVALATHPDVRLISATGSTRMGREVAELAAGGFRRCLLELGGNNAAIVAPSADLGLAVRGIVFAAAGTAGQRCTTLRRLIVHRSVHDEVVDRVAAAYDSLAVGNPLAAGTLVGPLIDRRGFDGMTDALRTVADDGGKVHGGDRVLADEAPDAYYVRPALAVMPEQTEIVLEETFAPLLYVMAYDDLDEAIAMNNASRHGLSSSIFTGDVREAERFTGPEGSDCGIANVNIGTSGAEIGGAFGGEKETGGGREAGSDAWKTYMRRSTSTVNASTDLPLAQGVTFV